MREKCGLIAISSAGDTNVTPMIISGLEALQHRGQESWGIAVEGFRPFRRMGLVIDRLSGVVSRMKGKVGIGHVRYSTKGKTIIENAHPIPIRRKFSIAQNGTIVNTYQLEAKVGRGCSIPRYATDTILAGLRLDQILREKRGDWLEAFKSLSGELIGAYCFVFLNDRGEAYAARDPRGFRPLCIGRHKESSSVIVASESCALTTLGAELVRDVEPGELLRLHGGEFESFRFSERVKPAHCAFEYTYFAHPSSQLDGVNVYRARKNIGRMLAARYGLRGDVVIPVPDSARPAALGYAAESGIPLEEGLMKDRYRKKGMLRSFIEPTQASREEVVKKIIPIKPTVEDKEVLIVDDSIVRGTSSKIISRTLRSGGARKVRMVVTFPPISYPCYTGIDFPTQEELLAYRCCRGVRDLDVVSEKVASEIDVDELKYNDISGLSEGIGLPLDHLCTSCISGDYAVLGGTPKFRTREEMKGVC